MKYYSTNFRHISQEQRQLWIGYNEVLMNGFETTGNHLIENYVDCFKIPMGVVPGMLINNKNYYIPLATEESSVIAALSKIAKKSHSELTISSGYTKRHISSHCYFGNSDQRLLDLLDLSSGQAIDQLKVQFPNLIKRGGNIFKISHTLIYLGDTFVSRAEIEIDPGEAMGANIATQIAEQYSIYLSEIHGTRSIMSILSNKNINSIYWSEITFPSISSDTANRIELASKIAEYDPARAATHNKGIMNAIDSLMITTGNDWRANSACIYSSLSANHITLSRWRYTQGQLIGRMEIPLQFGIVGGMTKIHPQVQFNLKLMNINTAHDLGLVTASIGLAQNLAALTALVTEGVMKGHMRLHQKNKELFKKLEDHSNVAFENTKFDNQHNSPKP